MICTFPTPPVPIQTPPEMSTPFLRAITGQPPLHPLVFGAISLSFVCGVSITQSVHVFDHEFHFCVLSHSESFEDAKLGGNRLEGSRFVLLHSMGEIGKLGSFGGRSARSISAIPTFLNAKGKVRYWSYLKEGLPAEVPPATTMKMQDVKELVVGQMDAIKVEMPYIALLLDIQYFAFVHFQQALHEAFSRPDKCEQRPPVPKHYATVTGTETTGAQLLNDWTDGIDLVIATGHGNWYKSLVCTVYDIQYTLCTSLISHVYGKCVYKLQCALVQRSQAKALKDLLKIKRSRRR